VTSGSNVSTFFLCATSLELIESLVMEKCVQQAIVIQIVHDMYINFFYWTDFGNVGYSSLNYLEMFSIHALQIDSTSADLVSLTPNDAQITLSNYLP